MPRIIIAAGGSGGHLFPATELAHQLSSHPDIEVIFMGGRLASNPFFQTNSFAFHEVACAPISLKRPFSALFNLTQGVRQSIELLRKTSPDLLVGFGSYQGFPPLLAARLTKIPYLLFESNVLPGKVLRLMARKAVETAICMPPASRRLKGRTSSVRMHTIQRRSYPKEELCRYYQLDPLKPTLLIFGGSQGARHINHLMTEVCQLWETLPAPQINILHFTGHQEDTSRLSTAYARAGLSAHVKDFEVDMAKAWTIADFSLSRSGACTCAEMVEYAVPGLLIPYPFASERHQEYNAKYLCDELGGGIWRHQKGLKPLDLIALFEKYLIANPEEVERMRGGLKSAREKLPKEQLQDRVWNYLN